MLTPSDPLTLLKAIGKQYGKRVCRANLFDGNVCTSPWDPEQPWKMMALPGDMFRHKVTLTLGERRIKMLANGEFISAAVSGEFNLDVCSINRQDKIFHLDLVPWRIPGFEAFPVYARQGQLVLRQLLASQAVSEALNALKLTESESVHFYRNGIILYLRRESTDRILSAVQIACNLARQLPGRATKRCASPD